MGMGLNNLVHFPIYRYSFFSGGGGILVRGT